MRRRKAAQPGIKGAARSFRGWVRGDAASMNRNGEASRLPGRADPQLTLSASFGLASDSWTDELMSAIVAKRLVEHLERAGFAKRTPIIGGAQPGRSLDGGQRSASPS